MEVTFVISSMTGAPEAQLFAYCDALHVARILRWHAQKFF